MNKILSSLGIISAVFVAILGFQVIVGLSNKIVAPSLGGATSDVINEITFFNATTTSAISTTAQAATRIDKANNVTWFFGRGDTTGQGNTATSTFSVQVSQDNSTWITYNKLIDNVINSNSETLTRVASVAIEASTSTKAYTMDLRNETYKFVRCVVVETTDGEHSCSALIRY